MNYYLFGDYNFEQKLNNFKEQVAIEVRIDGESVLAEVLEKSALHFSTKDLGGGYVNNILNPSSNEPLKIYFYVDKKILQRIGGRNNRHLLQETLQNELQGFFQENYGASIGSIEIKLADKNSQEWQNSIKPKALENNDNSFFPASVSYLRGNQIIDNKVANKDTILPVSQEDLDSVWGDASRVKIFISYCIEYKEEVHEFSNALSDLGVSCFVAHRNIHLSKEWRTEIKKALHSMDIFLAYLTDNFPKSNWTDQEAGFAISRGIPIIPLQVENIKPYGFIGEYQAAKIDRENKKSIIDAVHKIILDEFEGTFPPY